MGGQAALIALMVVAFLLLIVARTSSPSTPLAGAGRVGLGTRGRVADAAGHPVARGIAHVVRRPVRDTPARRRSPRPDPTASATR